MMMRINSLCHFSFIPISFVYIDMESPFGVFGEEKEYTNVVKVRRDTRLFLSRKIGDYCDL